MKLGLSVKQRLTTLAAIGAVVASVLGGAGWYGLNQAHEHSSHLQHSVTAVRASMNADMQHDAIRAEVMRSVVAGLTSNATELQAAKQAAAEHAQTLIKSLDEAARAAPAANTREHIESAKVVAQRYGQAATDVMAELMANPTQDPAVALSRFDVAFKALEETLEKTGDEIEGAATVAAKEATGFNERASLLMALIVACGLGALCCMSYWTISAILQPLRAMQQAVHNLNSSEGDLSRRLPPATAEFGEVSLLFNNFLDKIAGVVGNVQSAATEISSVSTQIAAGNDDLSRRTEQSSANLQATASSVEQITATVRQTAEAARQANELAGNASGVAARGGEAVSRVITTMEEINISSRKIGDIIGVIDGIAFQTNILALNAAVEAARAGEQGRGFAVVASEVRSLAQRSAEAAKEIKGLITNSVEKVENGGLYVREAGQTMAEIVASVDRVSTMINEITLATMEQSSGITLVNDTITDLDQATQQNTALVEETAAAAADMARQARLLADTVSVFRTQQLEGAPA